MNFLDLINEIDSEGELQPQERFGMITATVNRHVRDFPPISELPDLSGVQGFVTGPVWREAKGSELIPHLVFETVVARIRSVDELRLLADRGYFSREDYRRFGWSDTLFAHFLETGCVVSDWKIP